MLALTHGFAQFADGLLFLFGLAGHAAPAGRAVDQQFGDQACRTVPADFTLCLLVGDQTLKLAASVFQQQGQAFIQPALAIFGRCHTVEAHQRMQAQAGQRFAPVRLAVIGAADEVQHRQQRFAAAGQHLQFVTVLGQHRLAGIDHIQPGIGGQQLAQDLGFLFKALPRLAALQEPRQPRRAVEAFAGALQLLQVVEQGDGVFQPRCVIQFEQGFAVHR
ncbi:hypothetical protein D3C78_953800 [compost metagenome]